MVSFNHLKKVLATVCALSAVLSFHSSYAQAADATLTFTSTITASTCTVSIAGAAGSSTASVALNNVATSTGAVGVAIGTALAAAKPFTVGFTQGATTTACSATSKLNIIFGTPNAPTVVTTLVAGSRSALTVSGGSTNVGVEIESVNAGTVSKVYDYSTIPTFSGATFISSQHQLASVTAGTLLNFQATPVKAVASTVAIAAGSLSVAVPLTVAYN